MKICLLTPYGGTNLGDAAIQEAAIYNIRLRSPDAEICLVTLNPEKTTQLHKLRSFPLTSLTVDFYSQGRGERNIDPGKKQSLTEENEVPAARVFVEFKRSLRRFPLLFKTLKGVFGFLKGAVRFPRLFWQEAIHFVEARRFLKGFNQLLVSGGGQIDDYWGGPWGHPYSLFKWGVVAKSVGARYVFLSVGVSSLESKLSKYFIRRALKLSDYRSYRDNFSRDKLASMGIARGDFVYPDLVWSLNREKIALEKHTENSKKIVGISPISYLRHNWPQKDIQVYEHYIHCLASFIEELVARGYLIRLFRTDSPDRHAIQELHNLLKKENSLDNSLAVKEVNTDTLDKLLYELGSVDYVVASRLHGILLSHINKKPVLAISYDQKVDSYMNDIGLSEYCIGFFDLRRDVIVEKFNILVQKSEEILINVDAVESVNKEKLRKQYEYILWRE